jgi:GT2 family glycosyltransferase
MKIYLHSLRRQEDYSKIRSKQRIHRKLHNSWIRVDSLTKVRTMEVWAVVLIYSLQLQVILSFNIKRWWPKGEKAIFYCFRLICYSVKAAQKKWLIRFPQFLEIRVIECFLQEVKAFSNHSVSHRVTQTIQHSRLTISPRNSPNPLYWTIRQ